MIFQSFILGNLVSLCMKIINSVVVVGLYVELFFSHFLIMNDYVNSIDGAKVQIYSGIEQVGGDACSNL